MAGTDPIMDVATAPDLGLETRKEIQRLRKLLINPNEVHLFTRPCLPKCDGCERWITDRYIMVNVTGSLALKSCSCGGIDHDCQQFPDGGYKLTVGKGFVAKQDAFLPDSAGMLNSIERPGHWERLFRTQWSMADSDAKLMLAYTAKHTFSGSSTCAVEPYAINEEIWVAFQRAFEIDTAEPVVFEVCEDRPYRVSQDGKVVGYIAKAKFPDEQMREDAADVAGVVAKR